MSDNVEYNRIKKIFEEYNDSYKKEYIDFMDKLNECKNFSQDTINNSFRIFEYFSVYKDIKPCELPKIEFKDISIDFIWSDINTNKTYNLEISNNIVLFERKTFSYKQLKERDTIFDFRIDNTGWIDLSKLDIIIQFTEICDIIKNNYLDTCECIMDFRKMYYQVVLENAIDMRTVKRDYFVVALSIINYVKSKYGDLYIDDNIGIHFDMQTYGCKLVIHFRKFNFSVSLINNKLFTHKPNDLDNPAWEFDTTTDEGLIKFYKGYFN